MTTTTVERATFDRYLEVTGPSWPPCYRCGCSIRTDGVVTDVDGNRLDEGDLEQRIITIDTEDGGGVDYVVDDAIAWHEGCTP